MIYTFYSFKGGVGRLMALANVAECFYLRGLRVVMIDWDLEAPGLESFFGAPLPDDGPETRPEDPDVARARTRLGLIDMLEAYKSLYPSLTTQQADAGSGAFDALLDEYLPEVHESLHPIDPPPAGATRGPGLWLLPAGWRSEDRFASYARAVQSFDWTGFYGAFQGEAYFNWLRRSLKAFADVVLIDSRTGVTEMGGVCARQMADAVIALCAPNDQNMDGVSRMVQSFLGDELAKARQSGKWPHVIVVPTRIDASEEKRLARFRVEFHNRIDVLDATERLPRVLDRKSERFWELQIPYIPYYSYKEQRVIGPGITPDANRRLESAYKLLATYLAVLAPEGTRTRDRFADDIGRELPALRPRVTILRAADATADLVAAVRDAFTANAVARWPDLDVDDARLDLSSVTRCLERTESLVVPATLTTLASPRVKDAVREARRQGRCVFLVHDGGLVFSDMPAWARFGATLLDGRQTARMLAAVTAPCRSDRVPMMAPALPVHYVRRAEGARLRQLVLPASADGAIAPRPGRVIVAGLGGMGKTVLVTALCAEDEIQDAFEGGVLWLTLGPNPDLAALRLELYRALIAPTAAPAPASVSSELQRHLRERRVLLVLEDAHDGVSVRELARLAPQAVVVITTRDAAVLAQTTAQADTRETGPETATSVFTVGPMSTSEARELLAAHVHGAAGAPASATIDPLAEALGNLPLAVSLAGARLRQRAEGASPADVAGEIDRLTQTLNQRRFGDVEAGWRQHVLLPVSKVLTETLAAISREDRRRLETWAKEAEPIETPARLALLWGVTEADVRDVIGGLTPRSLVTTLPDGRYERSALASAVLVAGLTATAAAEVERRPNGSELRRTNPDVALANRVLAGQALAATDLLALAKRLATTRIFDLSRRVLATARTQPDARSDPALMRVLTQRQAFCTYKDRDLEPDRRFDWALSLLAELAPLDSTTDQETLGLAGAIHKNRWLLDGQRRHLERSLAFYGRGLAQGIDRDHGYTAINAAFVHDLLAWEAAQPGSGSTASADGPPGDSAHAHEARRIREQVAARLPQLLDTGGQPDLGTQWWFNATVAEACFGLDRYEDALAWIRRGQASPIDAWEYESTARQLAWLARIRHAAKPDSPAAGAAQNVLRGLLGGDPAALSGLFLGKVGLALSGGGFRASLFHIGVLARLADMDLLRHVEVLSCVSGGSIVGAHYYLKIRALLKDKADGEIRREDYQRVVAELIDEFLAGVQENIRLRVAASPGAALRMALSPDYSRTDRLGELYERHFYARVQDGEGGRPRFLSDLTIRPKGDPDCAPESDNWRRAAKVPMLVVNATSLNTAHNWQFTATWMGEPPDLLTTEIDANPRLERLYYWEAPERHQKVRLGAAVAASSCVPALFEPLSLRGLYPERRVQLVDGGVHDNQGLSALIEAQCTVTLVSDASGQTSEVLRPGTGTIGILSRTNAILQGRVREASLRDLLARVRGGLVRGLMFLHLKRDLAADPVGHKGRLDQPEAPGAVTGVKGALTSYGILRDVQKRLAAIRTDLDSFGDGEAFALMLSGYRMAQYDVPVMLRGLPGAPAATEGPAGRWRFFDIEPAATGAPGSEHAVAWLQDVLSVGSANGFKVWRLHKWLSLAATAAIATLMAGASLALPYALSGLLPAWSLGTALGFVALVVMLPVTLFVVHRLGKSSKSFGQIVLGLLLAAGGSIVVWLHLAQLDGLYLRAGRIPQEPGAAPVTPPPAAEGVPRRRLPPLSVSSRLSRSPVLGAWLLIAATIAGGYGIWWWNQQRTGAALAAEAARLSSIGRVTDAETIYRTVVADYPSQPEAVAGLGRLLLRRGETVEAEKQLNALKAADPFTLADRAFARRSNRNYVGALADYDAALVHDPQNADWLRGRAFTLAQAGRSADAIDAYKSALRLQPDLRSFVDRAALLAAANRLPEALADYRAALAIRPADPQLLAAAAAVERRMQGTTTTPNPDPPPVLEARLYVTVSQSDQLIAIQALGPALANAGIRLGGVSVTPVRATEFRYVTNNDYPEAMRIAYLFAERCLPVGQPLLGQAGASRPRHFELALGETTRVPSPKEFATGQCATAESRPPAAPGPVQLVP